MHKRGMHPGAIWKKSDLQIHTPRDPQWSGSPHLPGGSADQEVAREAWADNFVRKCIDLGLQAIAVTDHHDFCLVEYVQRAIKRFPNGPDLLWVIPGVEVTCNDAVQCLVLFDAAATPATWTRLFGGHFLNIVAPDPNAATNPQANHCGKNVEDFIKGIAADSGLNASCIVLPHASNEGAHKSMIRVGFHIRFRDLPFDGVYNEKKYLVLDEVTKKKIYGRIPDWGTRRRGIITTGDNRSANYDKLGVNACWIRLGEPTAESIRQAVLADEARIAYEQPPIPAQRILSISVNSSLTGETFELSLNDGFTALIGGRGSGKSALLEYLRFGLGRSAGDTDSDAEDERARDQTLVSDTLSKGFVKVTLLRDGVVETWHRSGAEREKIKVALPDGTIEELTIPAAQQRFRARAFYQKQLSTLVLDRRKAGEQITGIAAAESVDRRRLIDQEIAAAKRKVQAAFQQVIEFWVAEAEHNQSVEAVSDLKRRIDAIKKRLEESGLSPENQKLLDAAPTFNLVEALCAEAKTSIDADLGLLQHTFESVPSIDPDRWASAIQFEEVTAFLAEANAAKEIMQGALTQAKTAILRLGTAQVALAAAFQIRKSAFDIQHGAAAEQQASLKNLIDESKKLVTELQVAEAAERRNASKLKGLDLAPDALKTARIALSTSLQERFAILEQAAAQVEAMSANLLRAEVKREAKPEQYVVALEEICDGQRIRELRIRCEDWISATLTPGAALGWESVIDTVVETYRHKLQTKSASIEAGGKVSANMQNALLGQLTPQQVGGIYAKLDDARIIKLLTASAEDFISFEYKDQSGFIPFERASPGQQAAALMHLLLNQEAGTLIVDQPEDDLDNKVIMNIVHLVQTTKRKRQLIFATHNPNFVVNGDADKVVALTPGNSDQAAPGNSRVSIDIDGAIETPLVRTAITETMEGGRAAFELRGRKYLFHRLA